MLKRFGAVRDLYQADCCPQRRAIGAMAVRRPSKIGQRRSTAMSGKNGYLFAAIRSDN
jgi:hypothetical protein